MNAPPLIAIFGAAIGPSGRPSAALLRRIALGRHAALLNPGADLLCSGGVGRFGPSEASVMAERLVGQGIAPDRLILDEDSLDTLQSAVVAARLARARGGGVIVCSDGYHVPRIRVLLGVLGAASTAGPIAAGPHRASLGHRLGMGLRECAALPYDAVLAIVQRERLMTTGPGRPQS